MSATTEATYSPRSHHAVKDRVSALLPPLFFAPAAAFFAIALVTLPFLVPDLVVHFYQPRLLAVTHMITLGWLSMAMIGVLYRYLPALVKRGLPSPGAALAQWATFIVAVPGLVLCFWLGRWNLAAWAGGFLLFSAALLCRNLWPLLRSAPRCGVAELGIFASSACLIVAAALGTLLAVHKTYPLLGGTMLTNLGAHAHIAGVGWVGITVCALSYRFLPAFLLPAFDATDTARRLVAVLTALIAALTSALLAGSAWASALGFGVGVTVLFHAALVARVIASHQLPLDWTAWHAVASAIWCAIAAGGGAATAVLGVASDLETHLAAGYALAGLLGWFSNLLIGVSYKLFPAFVLGARNELGRPLVPIGSLATPEALRSAIFALFNVGLGMLVGGLVASSFAAMVLGTALLALAGALYGGSTLRTMAYVLLEPPPSTDPLTVLP